MYNLHAGFWYQHGCLI